MTDLTDLTDHMDGGDCCEEWQRPRRPPIEDDHEASRRLRKMHDAQREIARLEANLKAEVDWLRSQTRKAVAPLQNDVDALEAELGDYRERLEAERPDLPKTYRLPCGTLSRRRTPPKVEVVDEEAFIAWALDNEPTLVAIRPAASAIKAAVVDYDGTVVTKDGGEMVPGVALTSEERITVKPDLPGDL